MIRSTIEIEEKRKYDFAIAFILKSGSADSQQKN